MTNQAAHRTRLERILGVRLAEDAVRQWPQSGERLDGRARIGEVEAHFVGLRLGVGRRHALGDTIVVEWSTDYRDGPLRRGRPARHRAARRQPASPLPRGLRHKDPRGPAGRAAAAELHRLRLPGPQPGHLHWWTYTEDPASVPGKYGDATLAHITRSQTFTKQRRGQTQVRETFSAVADGGQVGLSLAYQQGGMVLWVTAEQPNLPLYAAKDPRVVRWYQEDQVLDVVRSDPLQVSGVSDLSLDVQGELADVFDGHQRVVAVFIQRPYMRQVYEP